MLSWEIGWERTVNKHKDRAKHTLPESWLGYSGSSCVPLAGNPGNRNSRWRVGPRTRSKRPSRFCRWRDLRCAEECRKKTFISETKIKLFLFTPQWTWISEQRMKSDNPLCSISCAVRMMWIIVWQIMYSILCSICHRVLRKYIILYQQIRRRIMKW